MRVFTARACVDHDQGHAHPEQPERLRAVWRALEGEPGVELAEAPPAPIETLQLRHAADYLALAERISRSGGGELGADTVLNTRSWAATLGATGASLAALQHALDSSTPAFAAVRPPGHHALRARAMGFCVVNHVAILAARARQLARERVLIVDWDVHHGNGTQAMVEREPLTRFVSMHQWPWYPGTGAATERGMDNCFNLPMAGGLPAAVYLETLWRGIERATTNWSPDVVLVSAGYDGMRGDPLGGFTLEAGDYVTWIERMRERFSGVPIVALMEGGYAPERLAAGVAATVRALA